MDTYPLNCDILTIPCLGSKLTLSSRWEHSDNGAIWSAWAGSSIKFYSEHPLSCLFVRIGPKTERKDRWNGGTPLFAVSVEKTLPPNHSSGAVETKTFEAEPGMLIQLWDEPIKECLVKITLIDWASILEIDGFVSVSGVSRIPRIPDVLTNVQRFRILEKLCARRRWPKIRFCSSAILYRVDWP
jgi:hypothetical protein